VGQIYIAYRRDDTGALAGRVADRLRARFGAEAVLKDADATHTPGGAPAAVRLCAVELVMIGPRWLSSALADPNGQTYAEIVIGLSKGITVIPVLVHGATLPDPRLLPPALAPFVTHGFAVIGPEATFDRDTAALGDGLQRFMPRGGYRTPKQVAPRRAPALPGEVAAQARRGELGRRALLLALVIAIVIAAGGGGGLLLARRIGAITTFNFPRDAQLKDIASPPGTDDVWAVGGNTDFCILLHETAGAWSRVNCPLSAELDSLSFVSNGDGWAVGGEFDHCGLLHYYHGSWSPVACPTGTSFDEQPIVRMDSHGDGWIAGGKSILRYQNGAWTQYTGGLPDAISGLDELAIGGQGVFWGRSGINFVQAVGGTWTAIQTPGLSFDFYCSSMDFSRTGDTGWAVGESGNERRAYIAQYLNGGWQPYPEQPSVSELTLVRVGLFGDVWAAGGAENKTNFMQSGLILRYDGRSWQALGDPVDGEIWGITDVANGDAWAVGSDGYGTALLWYHAGYWRTYFTTR
jgi:hypothetical protein